MYTQQITQTLHVLLCLCVCELLKCVCGYIIMHEIFICVDLCKSQTFKDGRQAGNKLGILPILTGSCANTSHSFETK